MYKFVCSGRPSHFSYSASLEQDDPGCPECAAPTHPISEIEQMHKEGASVMDISLATGVSAPAIRAILPEKGES